MRVVEYEQILDGLEFLKYIHIHIEFLNIIVLIY